MKTFFAFLALSEFFSGYSTAAGQLVEPALASDKPSLYIPNLLKINSKGNMEKWEIHHLDSYPEHRVKIFNRKGQMVFTTRKYANNWPEGIPAEEKYFYILETEGKRVSGWIDIEI